jgi:putative transposase
MTKDSINSLSHTRWKCKYHLVFAPKFRRQVIYGKIRSDIGRILRTLCDQKKVEIHEAEACPDHIHIYAGKYPTTFECISICWIFEGKKFFDDF